MSEKIEKKGIKEKINHLYKDGFFHILFGNTLNKMIAFVSSIVIVRLVSKTDYGYLSYADNLYNYITIFYGLGLSTAILKFCSPKKSAGENKFYFLYALKYGTLFQAVLSAVLAVYVLFFPITFPEAKNLVLVMLLYPVIYQVEQTILSFLRAMLNNKLYARASVIQTVVAFACSVLFVRTIGIIGVPLARYLAIVAAILFAFNFVKANIPRDAEAFRPEKKELQFFWKVSISLMLASLFSMVMPINEQFLVNHIIKDPIVTANYKVAILIPSQLPFVTNSIVVYVFPKIAQMSDDLKKTYQYTVKVEMVVCLIIAVISVAGYLLTPTLLTLIYGDRYADAIDLSKIYWIAYGANSCFRLLPLNILPAVGVVKANSIVSLFTCVFHIVLLYFFLNMWGIDGAGYALIIVYGVSALFYWICLARFCNQAK